LLDEAKIINEIIAAGVSPVSAEHGGELVEAWINKFYVEDIKIDTMAVEMGFVLWPDANTLVIGVMDRVARDADGILGSEWKSTSGSKWWTEEKWLKEISNGSQLATYAWALKEGLFLERNPLGGEPTVYNFNVDNPRIMVRAAVKSRPCDFWPHNPKDGLFRFDNESIEFTKNAYRNMAEQIRALRKTRLYPWQLTGKQCFNFNRTCGFFETCSTHSHPIETPKTIFDPHDPAAKLALAFVDARLLANPELVILSASQYANAASCKEKYRLVSGAIGEKENDIALETGSALHAGLGEYYRQLKEALPK
jgi:hypothetical protein